MTSDGDNVAACAAELPGAPAATEELVGAPSETTEPTDRTAAGADEISAESIVEAVLLATDAPLPAAKIAQVLGFGDARVVKKHIAVLNQRYEQMGAAFRVEELAGGFQLLTLPAYHKWVSRVRLIRRETKLTAAALETLAVVAYKQPVMRADVEAVRGVAVGDILNRLREMGLVKIVGRAEVVGRPMLYGTTKKFLEAFGLASLDDLPQIEALPPPASARPPSPREGETDGGEVDAGPSS